MTGSRLHEDAMRVLMGEIVSAGRYAEGDRLPKAEHLAEQFGVSVGVVRECLRALQERGLVTVRHGHGAVVRAREEWSRFDPEVLAALLTGGAAAGVLGEYLECRRILEVEAAGLAAERASPGAVESVSNAFASMGAAAKSAQANAAAERRYHEADIGFHRAVVRAAGNPTLGQVTEPIHRALSATFSALARPQKRFERGLPEHERILEAIAEHDEDAARAAMREHLLTVEGYLHEYNARQGTEEGA